MEEKNCIKCGNAYTGEGDTCADCLKNGVKEAVANDSAVKNDEIEINLTGNASDNQDDVEFSISEDEFESATEDKFLDFTVEDDEPVKKVSGSRIAGLVCGILASLMGISFIAINIAGLFEYYSMMSQAGQAVGSIFELMPEGYLLNISIYLIVSLLPLIAVLLPKKASVISTIMLFIFFGFFATAIPQLFSEAARLGETFKAGFKATLGLLALPIGSLLGLAAGILFSTSLKVK